MGNIKQQQLEALETLAEFNDRILKNLPTIIDELSGNLKPDTDQYLKSVIDAINWEISVTNATLDILNEGQIRIDKAAFNKEVLALNDALASDVNSTIANALKNLTPFFEQLGVAAKEVTQ